MAEAQGTAGQGSEEPRIRRRRRSDKHRRKRQQRKALIGELQWMLKGVAIGLPLLALLIYAASHL